MSESVFVLQSSGAPPLSSCSLSVPTLTSSPIRCPSQSGRNAARQACKHTDSVHSCTSSSADSASVIPVSVSLSPLSSLLYCCLPLPSNIFLLSRPPGLLLTWIHSLASSSPVRQSISKASGCSHRGGNGGVLWLSRVLPQTSVKLIQIEE